MEQDEEMPEISDHLHPNVIIHVDFDYYYAQVEEVELHTTTFCNRSIIKLTVNITHFRS